MKEIKETSKNSTVAISAVDTERLDRFCSAYKITKKDFITASLSYFEKEGIDPRKHESPKSEIEKIYKRVNSFFGFLQTQEQNILKPLGVFVAKSEQEQKGTHETIINNQIIIDKKIKGVKESLTKKLEGEQKLREDQTNKFAALEKKIDTNNKAVQNSLELLSQFMDEKNNSGLKGAIKKIFK